MVNEHDSIYNTYNTTICSFFKEKYRIISLNFFEKGIKPEWEDPKNKGGTIFLMEYTLFHAEDYEDFFKSAQKSWTTMILSVLGEVALLSKYVSIYICINGGDYRSQALDLLINQV
jgi:hypothetical protein